MPVAMRRTWLTSWMRKSWNYRRETYLKRWFEMWCFWRWTGKLTLANTADRGQLSGSHHFGPPSTGSDAEQLLHCQSIRWLLVLFWVKLCMAWGDIIMFLGDTHRPIVNFSGVMSMHDWWRFFGGWLIHLKTFFVLIGLARSDYGGVSFLDQFLSILAAILTAFERNKSGGRLNS